MGPSNHAKCHDPAQPELGLFTPPTVIIPAISIRQPDGSLLIKAGKPIVVDEMINTKEAAKLLGMSHRWILSECETGAFKSAHKPGQKRTSRWKIARAEVLARQQSCPE